MLDNKNFRYFSFGDVFEYKRGRRLVSSNQIPGDIAYISSTAVNNGVDNYITPPEYMTVYKNKLTLSNSGSVGCLFYHDYDFVASDHVMVIWPKNIILNKYISMFLKPIFEAIKYKYNFGREINEERLSGETLFLPVDSNGNPDWKYMEEYIKDLIKKINFEKIPTNNKTKKVSNISTWRDFLIGDIFECSTTSHLIGTFIEKGDIPYVTRSSYNNGVSEFITNDNYAVNEANCITIGAEGGVAFYQEIPFVAGIKIYTLRHKRLNKYNALFICTLLNANTYKYSYGRARILDKLKKECIKMPVDAQGKPDWDYMEKYIKSLPYADLI